MPAAGTGGTYALTVIANNGIGVPALLHMVLSIDQPLAITSAGQTTFWLGIANSFTLVAKGFPNASYVESGTLPKGVAFDPATGILSGSPPIGSDGTYPLTFIAENGFGANVVQSFSLSVRETANQLYVDAVYQNLLGHAPDPVGLASWSGQLDRGDSRTTIINLFDHSSWYFSSIIQSRYQQFLGRTVDSGGLAFWIQQTVDGLTDEQFETSLIASPEYYQHANGTNKGWLDAMYADLLGRRPDSPGREFLDTAIGRRECARWWRMASRSAGIAKPSILWAITNTSWAALSAATRSISGSIDSSGVSPMRTSSRGWPPRTSITTSIPNSEEASAN